MTDELALLFALLTAYAAFMTVRYFKATLLLRDRANIIARLVQDEEYYKGVCARWHEAAEMLRKGDSA